MRISDWSSDVCSSDLSGDAGDELLFAIDVPEGAKMLNILTYGGSGNINLYSSHGAEPSPGDADARSERRGNSATIRFARPAAGTHYIKVQGVTSCDPVALQARTCRGTHPHPAGAPHGPTP